MEAFYRYAFVALRSVLELGVLGVYFAVNDKEHEHVRPWLVSEECTPRFRAALNKLKEMEKFEQFDERFGLVQRILDTYNTLSDFVHTRGLRYSSRGHTRVNYNHFSEMALRRYCSAMFSLTSDLIITMLLKYPIGMQGLPLTEKFGLNTPFGGFLEMYQVELITSVLEPEERDFLKSISDEDPNVREFIEYFESLPDLSEEEWRRQVEEFDKQYPPLPKVPD